MADASGQGSIRQTARGSCIRTGVTDPQTAVLVTGNCGQARGFSTGNPQRCPTIDAQAACRTLDAGMPARPPSDRRDSCGPPAPRVTPVRCLRVRCLRDSRQPVGPKRSMRMCSTGTPSCTSSSLAASANRVTRRRTRSRRRRAAVRDPARARRPGGRVTPGGAPRACRRPWSPGPATRRGSRDRPRCAWTRRVGRDRRDRRGVRGATSPSAARHPNRRRRA